MKNLTSDTIVKEKLRYAPSPTGPLHAGNLSTALFTYYRAKSIDAQLILRMDSLDPIRCKETFVSAIVATLKWAGLKFNGPIHHQYPHHDCFKQAFDTLKESQLIYPCFCSRREALQTTENGALTYRGTCRNLLPSITQNRIQNGDPHCWRFRVQCDGTTLNDVAMGKIDVPAADWGGDFIIWRRDNCPAYPLASVVDDSELNITEINRGRDLIAPSAAQTLLFQALNKKIPRFLHFPLFTDGMGKKLSKRNSETCPEILFHDFQAFIAYWTTVFQVPQEELNRDHPAIDTILSASRRDNILFKTLHAT